MAKIDGLKEELGILKFWLGIVVAVTIGILGWVFTNLKDTDNIMLILAVIAIITLLFILYFINKSINKKIKEISKTKG